MSSRSSSSSIDEEAVPPQNMEDEDEEVDGQQAILPPPPQRYTLKQAFYKACSYSGENETSLLSSSVENDMLLTGVSYEEKQKLVDYYEYANNPSAYRDKYYTQYHAFELSVFKKHAVERWDAIVEFVKNNQQLQKRYSKSLSYMLQKQCQCINSYLTVILMVIAYPRH